LSPSATALADRKWLGVVKAELLCPDRARESVEALEKAGKTLPRTRSRRRPRGSPRPGYQPPARRFAIEVNKLGVAGLAIELQQARHRGVPFSPKCV